MDPSVWVTFPSTGQIHSSHRLKGLVQLFSRGKAAELSCNSSVGLVTLRRVPHCVLYFSWLAESAVLCQPLGGVQRLARGCYFAFHHSQPLEHAQRRWRCCGSELVLLLLSCTSAALYSFVPTVGFCSGATRSHRNAMEISFTCVRFGRDAAGTDSSSFNTGTCTCAHSNTS